MRQYCHTTIAALCKFPTCAFTICPEITRFLLSLAEEQVVDLVQRTRPAVATRY